MSRRERDDELRARLQQKVGPGWSEHEHAQRIENSTGDDLDEVADEHGVNREDVPDDADEDGDQEDRAGDEDEGANDGDHPVDDPTSTDTDPGDPPPNESEDAPAE